MKYLLFILILIGWMSCNFPNLDIFHEEDIIKQDTIPPVDTIGNDTNPPLPLDTPCILVPVTEPKFVTLVVNFPDGFPDTAYFHHAWSPAVYLDIKTLLISLGFNSDSIVVYQGDSSMAVIIRGTNNKSILDTKIYITPMPNSGIKSFYMASIQGFFFEGALTFQEYKEVALSYPSVRGFNFLYCHWTQAQYEEVATIILGECKEGREWADFIFNDFPISDSLYCLFIQNGWVIVRGQTPMCSMPQPLMTSNTNKLIQEYERLSINTRETKPNRIL